jgi:hypothetical protein
MDMETNLRRIYRGLRTATAAAAAGAAATFAATAALGAAAVLLPAPAAHADATTYATSKRQYKVGILLLDSTIDANGDGIITPAEAALGPENTDPHLFYIADALQDMKPQNWELINPLAPPTVTTEIFNRWSAPGGRDPGNPYVLGQKVTKNMAAYWEVPLSRTSEADLLKFDLLFITNHRLTRLSLSEREKLRKAVDAGAVIWLEDCGNMRMDPRGPFFLEDLQFNGGGGGGGGPVVYTPNHPILNTPYRLSFSEIANLGDKNYGNFYLVTQPPPPAGPVNRAPNPEVLTTIVGNSAATDAVTGRALPYIAAGNYGSGAVVVTAGDSGCDINDYAGGVNIGVGGNSGAYCGPNIRTAHTEDLKFLYNLIAWGSSNNTYRRNMRRTGANFEGVNAPLVTGFDFNNAPLASRVVSRSAPLISKGILYVAGLNSAGNITVRAYDTQPGRDYDADGNPDDGWGDLNAGYPFDEIWRWDGPGAGGGQPSSPTLVTLLDAVGNQVEVILVNLPDGTLVALPPLPFIGGTRTLAATNAPVAINATTGAGTYAAAPNGVAPSPVVFENKIYVIQPNGVVRCINGANIGGDPLWLSTAAAAPPALNPTGSPSLGTIRLTARNPIADASNGTTNDIVLYAPVEDATSGTTVGKIAPFWLGTRNEVHKDPAGGIVRTRVARADEQSKYFIAPGGPGTGFIVPRVRIFETEDPDGAVGPLPPTRTREENYAAGNPSANFTYTFRPSTVNDDYYSGEIEIRRASGGALIDPNVDKVLVSVDYDLVYAPPTGEVPPFLQNAVAIRGGLNNPALVVPGYAGGLDTVAIAPNDLLIYGATQLDTNITGAVPFATVFALSEQEFSANASRLRWRFPLHPGTLGNPVSVGGIDVVEAPALRNRLQFLTADSAVFDTDYEPLTNAQIVGSPVVTNDGVSYVLAQAVSPRINGGAAVTVLMAFKTDPTITLTLPEAFEPGTAQLSQLNMMSFDTGAATGQTITASVSSGNNNNQGQFIEDASRGRITITGFQPPAGGAAFSASQSFVVRYTPVGSTTSKSVVLPPSPTIPNFDTGSGQVVLGDDASGRQGAGGFSPLLWHYVLPGQPLSGPTLIGSQIYFTRIIAGGGSEVVAVDANPEANDPTVRVGSGEQVYNVVSSLQGNPVTNNHVRWVRAVTGTGGAAVAAAAPLVGAEGTLAVNSDSGTFAFQESVTLIADSRRILEVAADGSAVWAVNATLRDRTIGGANPVYTGNPANPIENPGDTGRLEQERKTFSRPQMARKLTSSDYLVADTGNNRAVRIDRSGKILWSVERVNDPYGVLAAGDSTTLNQPTDVQYYQVRRFENPTDPTPNIIEDHYIIADAGNYRIIEVADIRDAQGNPIPIADVRGGPAVPGLNVVVWTSRTGSKQGRQLRYQSVRAFPGRDETNGRFGRPTLVAVVANTTAAGPNSVVGTDFTGGSVVVLDYNPINTPFVTTDFNGANPTQEIYWPLGGPEPANNGLPKLSIGEIVIRTGGGAGTDRIKRISRPTYFERVYRNVGGTPSELYLICDAEGVYACTLEPQAAIPPGGPRAVFVAQFKMEQEDYNAMNVDPTRNVVPGVSRMAFTDGAGNAVVPPAETLPRFVPTSVKLLPSGNYLITNSATGESRWFRSGKFVGEVFEVVPQALIPNQTVTLERYGGFSAPRLDQVILRPPGPSGMSNEQRMGTANNTSLTEQPLSSDRL